MFIINNMTETVVIAAGGSGGHIIPALVVSDIWIQKKVNIIFITDRKFDNYSNNFQYIINHYNFEILYIDMPNFSEHPYIQKIIRSVYAIKAIFRIIKNISNKNVKAVIGFGSYVSLPTIIAGWIIGKKTFIHEQNSHMGLANRISMIFVKLAMLSFTTTSGIPFLFKYKTIISGFPLRKEIKELHYQNVIDTINYESFFKIYDLITIVIIGGSQGAKLFQDIIPEAIMSLHKDIRDKIQIYHQVRSEDVKRIANFYQENNISYEVGSFFANAPELMSKAHIIISRSGAGTLFEIMALGTPSVLIPYPLATNNHQLKNALFMQNNGAAVVVEQKDINSQKITDILLRLFNDHYDLSRLSHNAKRLSDINADIKIIRSVEKIVGHLGIDFHIKTYNSSQIVSTNVSIG